MQLKTKPSGIYYVDVTITDEVGAAKRRRISFDTRDEGEARAQRRLWLAGRHPKQLAEAFAKPKVLVSAKVAPTGWTVRQAMDRCLNDPDVWLNTPSEKVNVSNAKALYALCGDEQLADLDYERVSEIIKVQRQQGIAPGTIARRMASLGRAVKMSTIWKDPKTGKPYLAGRPTWPQIKVDDTRSRIISYEEQKAIFDAIDKRRETNGNRRNWWLFKCFIRILLDTGMRVGETVLTEVRNVRTSTVVDPRTGEPRLAHFMFIPAENSKSGKDRLVPLSPAVVELLPALNAQACKGRWFPWGRNATTPWTYWDAIRTDLKEAGMDLSDVVQHTFRHTCATRLAMAGTPVQLIQSWLGHHDVSITVKRYVKTPPDQLLMGLDALEMNYRKAEVSPANASVLVTTNIPFNEEMRANTGTAH